MFGATASALTVSPAKVEITGDPGTTIYGEIKLFNEQDGTRTFFSSSENFEPTGDTGAPHFIGAKDGLATWIGTDAEVTLGSGEYKTIPFSITIPADARPGGYFAAIFWGSQPVGGGGSGEVSIGGKIGVLVLLRVSGDVSEEAGLSEFRTNDNQKFFTTIPVTFTYLMNNTGGDRIVPLGDVVIKNTFRMTSATLSSNKNQGSVLPGSTRKFDVVWGDETQEAILGTETETDGFFEALRREWQDFHFGWYTAHLSLAWGVTNQTADASYHFFIFPWHLLLVILVILFLGVMIVRKYNRFIIAKASQQYKNG